MAKIKSKRKAVFIAVWLALIALVLAGIFVIGLPGQNSESISEVMRDGVLHEQNKIDLFSLKVNPALISAYAVTAVLLLAAAVIRIFFLPKFKIVPGRFQSAVEKLAELFYDMGRKNSPHKPKFLSAYIFSAAVYIFASTLFELFGFQAITDSGRSIALPAPLADINGAIAMGVLSYLVILAAGAVVNKGKGVLGVLKDFSLPISMSFRLFGALLSGYLVTELVYYYVSLSFVLPVVVGVLFTLLHAVIQAYVLTTLVSIFYGEATEPTVKKTKTKKEKKVKI